MPAWLHPARLALALLSLLVAANADTPVTKVLSMLNEMLVKAQAGIKAETLTFTKYTEWMDDTVKDLAKEIEFAESEIEKLVAFIDKAESDAQELGRAIGEIDAEVAELEGNQKDLTAQRGKDNAEFEKTQMDYAESVDALDRAIQILKSQNYDRPQAMMLLQKMASKSTGMQRAYAILLEAKEVTESSEAGAPEAAAYEFQSSHVIELLEKLLDKFQTELGETEKAEMNSQHAYDLQMVHLGNTIADLKSSREDKAEAKAKLAAESAAAQGELAGVRTDLAADKKLKAETVSTYEAKKGVYTLNQKVRQEEIEALEKAIEIISNPAVAGSYAKRVNAELLQRGSAPRGSERTPPSFLQTGSAKKNAERRALAKAAAHLQRRATVLASATLRRAAEQIAENPFGKVIDMIKSLITRLQEAAATEADQKAFCDDELKKNKRLRNKKQEKVETLMADIGTATSTIADMAKEIANLSEEQASLTKAMQEATSTRMPEKEENEATIKDAAAGQEAVQAALGILREYYATHAMLLQVPAGHPKKVGMIQVGKAGKQVPEMEEYKGQQRGSGGVIGMLEVILSDFARVEADTKSAEDTAQREYERFMAECKAAVESKHKQEFQVGLKKDQAEFEKSRLEKDLEVTEKELAAAKDYFASLKVQCIDVHVSYEERVKKRQEEIEALNEAYKILDSADFNSQFAS